MADLNSNFIKLAKKRFSARNYFEKPINRENIELCLEAARLAPSACNSQPWKFIIVDEPGLKNRLCDKIFSGAYKMNMFAKKAPVIVVVISEKSSFIASVGAFLRNTRYYLIDIGISVEHFCLQAAEIGLGTCWIGWFNEKEAKKILGLSENKKIDVVISVGYTDEAPPKKEGNRSVQSLNSTYNAS